MAMKQKKYADSKANTEKKEKKQQPKTKTKKNTNVKPDFGRCKNRKGTNAKFLPYYQPMQVQLIAKRFTLHDAAFHRRYLVESKPPEGGRSVGDLVWIKLRGRPWWPAMITPDPQQDIFAKYGPDCLSCYHVQYFGASPHHGWVESNRVRSYEGFAKFDSKMHFDIAAASHSGRTAFAATRRIYEILSLEQGKMLNEAIAEAEAAYELNTEIRLRRLTFRYYSVKYSRYFE